MQDKQPARARLLVEQNGDVTVVYFQDTGILDERNINLIAEELFGIVETKNKIKLLLNFEKVEYLSSAVLGKLVALQKKVKEFKGDLHLCCIRESILKVFQVTKLDKLFKIYDNQQRGVKAFSGISLFGKK
ncbi:MAG: STAS domain-containing protein [Planctomycetes bacterium]|nr:STAS domain-containing protein [Planctomycetota bacterium]